MNYHILKQIVNYSQEYKKIKSARRVAENKILLELDNNAEILRLIIDLQGAKSAIYCAQIYGAEFKSSFDILLAKTLNGAKITASKISENNRIWRIEFAKIGAYKSEAGSVIIEFFGRKNNFILLGENGEIKSALRYEREKNIVQNAKYFEPQSAQINDKNIKIENIKDFLHSCGEAARQNNCETARKSLISQLEKKLNTQKAKLNALQDATTLSEQAKTLYKRADILKANLYKLKHFERDFVIENEHFVLSTSPQRALNEIYKLAKKFAAKAQNITREYDNLSAKIAQFSAQIAAARAIDDENLLKLLDNKKTAAKKSKNNPNVLEFFINCYKISVGLNEAGNASLLARAKRDDWWFHLRAEPGAHAILQTAKKTPDIDIIYQAALLAAVHSGKDNGVFEVDFTQRSKLHREGLGARVNYSDYDSIKVFLGSAAALKPRAR